MRTKWYVLGYFIDFVVILSSIKLTLMIHSTMIKIQHLALFCIISKLCYVYCNNDLSPVTFTFKEYQYKDTPKNEMTFREFETACEQSSACSHMAGLARIRCVRECVSPSCYRDLYQADPLEEGEIDVRLNSFKGCFVQRSGRTRN